MPHGTKDDARAVLMRILEQRLGKLEDASLIALLQDGSLLKQVFEDAWEHQFDRDRTTLERSVRDTVQSAVMEQVSRNAD